MFKKRTMYKTCPNATCKHNGEPQTIRNFSRRGGKARFLKDGVTPQFSSYCKSCNSGAQNKRIIEKRATARAEKRELTAITQKEAKTEEACSEGVDRYRGTINPYFLVRGNITYENLGDAISYEA